MFVPLPPAFYQQPTLTVAEQLIGKFLVRQIEHTVVGMMVSETEAYDGPRDLASHARFGRTPRTEVMFGEPGTVYVYLVYGLHWMLNIVCGRAGYLSGSSPVARRWGYKWTSALTRALAINHAFNAQTLGHGSGLWIKDRGKILDPADILPLPRVGVAYAGSYSKKPWRFLLKGAAEADH